MNMNQKLRSQNAINIRSKADHHTSADSQSSSIGGNTNKRGFTLIELSIVLVIIGLLVGGVLVGQDLIEGAKMRAQISDMEKINVAANTFRLTYDCLPGDCKDATDFFSATVQPEQVTNGNGDRKIIGAYGPNVTERWDGYNYGGSEWPSFYDHLAAADMIELTQFDEDDRSQNRPGIAYPLMKMKTQCTSGMVTGWETPHSYNKGGHRFRLGARNQSGATTTEFLGFECGLTFDVAQRLDTKIDDGLPLSGNTIIMGAGHNTYRIHPGTSGSNDARFCAPDGGTNEYYTDATFPGAWVANFSGRCALSIKAAF